MENTAEDKMTEVSIIHVISRNVNRINPYYNRKKDYEIIKQCSIVCCIEEMHLYQNHSEKLKIKYKPRYTRKY